MSSHNSVRIAKMNEAELESERKVLGNLLSRLNQEHMDRLETIHLVLKQIAEVDNTLSELKKPEENWK